MGRSPENHTDHNGPPGSNVPSEGKAGVEKEREIKEDGRYLIYYDFEDQGEREGRGS